MTQIWPLPDDLPHAAGAGDFARVRGWFDEAGRPRLGSLSQHHPTNHPSWLRNLHWMPPNAQQVLDVALAWACMNRQFEIADFLLKHGANINTDWSTHEPASILHECAVHANYEAAQFLIDRGIDMTIHDYRWNATVPLAEESVESGLRIRVLTRADRFALSPRIMGLPSYLVAMYSWAVPEAIPLGHVMR